jgi:hypothetical protein
MRLVDGRKADPLPAERHAFEYRGDAKLAQTIA